MSKRPPSPTKAVKYDLDFVRSAASSRWPEIISHVCGIDVDYLDGQHHPCPECGGTDRFRYFNDGTGGAICNNCFRDKNGDGFAVVQWSNKLDFSGSLAAIADYLGIQPDSATASSKKRGKTNAKANREEISPDENLKFLPWNDVLANIWCITKPPITIFALKHCHARMARYREQYTVIALPVWGEQLTAADPVGWSMYNITGGELPKFTKDPKGGPAKVEMVKVKLTYGSQPGMIGPVELLAGDHGKSITHLWKLEGPSDLLAWYSLPGREEALQGHLAITNANGAKEKFFVEPWMVALFAGRQAIVMHDADRPGQDGALGYGTIEN